MKFSDYSTGVALGFLATANLASVATAFTDYFRFEDYVDLIVSCYVWSAIYFIPGLYLLLKKLYEDVFGVYSA